MGMEGARPGFLDGDLSCSPTFQAFASVTLITGLAFTGVWFKAWWRFWTAIRVLKRENCRCMADVRRKEKSGSKAYATRSSARDPKDRKISVLLPVKGVHSQTIEHWNLQLKSSHGGEIEYIFCIESKDDPAYEAVKQFKKTTDKTIKIVVAGLSFYSTQKIHNLLEGVKHIAKDSELVMFLDDDSEMRSVIMRDLIHHSVTDPSAMIVTGYPHEYIPSHMQSVPFAGYLLLGYRKLANLNLAFDYPPALWGGCLVIRREDLFDDKVGILTAWRNHGYSDDMIVAGRVYRSLKRLRHPTTCMMVNEVDPKYTIARHWNYMARQMFVLDTYTCTTERIQNYLLLFLVCIVVVGACFWFQVLSVVSVLRLLWRLITGKLFVAPWGVECGMFNTPPEVLELCMVGTCLLFFFSAMLADAIITKMSQLVSDQQEKFVHKQPLFQHLVGSFFGLMGQMFVQSSTAFLTGFNSSIVWSGVRYHRKGGKVREVWRVDKEGKPYTVPRQESLQQCLKAHVVAE